MTERPVQLGIVASALSDNLREALQLSLAAGFAGVVVEAFSKTLNLAELSQTGRRELRRLLSSADQQLIALRVDVGRKGFGPGTDIDRLLSQFEKVMDAAKGLGALMVCVEAGPLPEPNQNVDAALTELGRRADGIGMTLAFRSDLSSFAAVERALAPAACPWFGVDLDPVAILRDDWSIDEFFSRLGPQVRHVRGRDAILGSDRRTQPAIIGQGSIDWSQLLRRLDQGGYRGWLTIDPQELPDRAPAAAAGLKFLKS